MDDIRRERKGGSEFKRDGEALQNDWSKNLSTDDPDKELKEGVEPVG